jgi:hypothetical protein
MQELRVVAVSEDGTYVVLAQPGRATRFSLPNDERLRAVARGQFSRLAQYEIEVESPLRPKEIQARIRSGETAEQIADEAGVPIERVRWFEGPVLAERAYIAQQAQTASVRRPGDSGPGPRLGEIVGERLRVLGADPDEAQWDSRKRGDGSWLVELTSSTGAERLTAAWVFDPRRRHAAPDDDEAARLSLSEDALQTAGLAARPGPGGRGRGPGSPFVPRSHSQVGRPAVEPESEPAAQVAAQSASRRASEPVSPSVSQRATEQMSQVARATSQDIGAEATERGRHSAGQHDPQAPPSGTPQYQPTAHGTRRPEVPEPQVPGTPQAPAPRVPEVRAAATQQVDAPRQSPAAPAAEPAAGDEAETQESQARGRSTRKTSGRGRRSSVPTWDEIMFGSSRRQD